MAAVVETFNELDWTCPATDAFPPMTQSDVVVSVFPEMAPATETLPETVSLPIKLRSLFMYTIDLLQRKKNLIS